MAAKPETGNGRRTALKIGALFGGLIGALFAAGYAATSVWICSGALACSSHWLPFLVVPGAVFAGSILFGAAMAYTLRRFYELTRV